MGPALYHWAMMARMPLCCCLGFRTPDPTPATETKFSWSLCVVLTPSRLQDPGRNIQMQSLGHKLESFLLGMEKGVSAPFTVVGGRAR